MFEHEFRRRGGFYFLPQFLCGRFFAVAAIAKFFLDGPHLFMEPRFPLGISELRLDVLLDFVRDSSDFELFADQPLR